MPSDLLYEKLAEALSQPSHAYRAAQAGLGIPQQALEGYLSGSDIADKLRQRKLAQTGLAQMLGKTPAGYEDFADATPEMINAFKSLPNFRPPQPITFFDPYNTNTPPRVLPPGSKPLPPKPPPPKVEKEKPPTGYRWDAEGNLVAIPGGPADTKLKNAEEKKANAQRDVLEKSRLVVGKIDEALSGIGPWTTGVAGKALKNVPGTPAKNLQETLMTVRSNVGFDTLQNMRQNSPTGGALGQVSDSENRLMQAVRGSLDQEQSTPQLVKNLQDLRKHFMNVTLAIDGQTGDPEADAAIAQVISSDASDQEKRARIQGIKSAAGR